MTKEIIYAVNVTLDAYSVLISLIIAGSIFLFKKKDKPVKWFVYTNIAAVLYGISDIIMWISEGTDAKWKLIALPVSSFIFFFVGILVFVCYIGYIISYYRKTSEISNKYFYCCVGLAAVYILCLIISQFMDNGFYYITEQNTYVRGKLFNITIYIEVCMYVEAILLIFKFHKNVQSFENIGFASFIFVPFICHIIQLANFGIALTSVGLAISFFIIYLNLNHKMQQEIEEAKSKLDEKTEETEDSEETENYSD